MASMARANPVGLYAVYALYGTDVFLDYALFAAFVLFAFDGGGYEAAGLAIAFAAPSILIGPVLGARLESRSVWRYLTVAGIALLVTAIAMGFATGPVMFIALAAVRATARLAHKIALPIIISQTFDASRYAQAHSRLQTVMNGGKVAGPALAAGLLAAFGPEALIIAAIVLAISLLAATAFARPAGIVASAGAGAPSRSRSTLVLLRLGVRAIRASRAARIGLTAFAISSCALYLSDDLIALLFKHIGLTARDVSVSIAVIGAGASSAPGSPIGSCACWVRLACS